MDAEAAASDTGSMSPTDSGSSLPVDSGSTAATDSGNTVPEDAGFAMDSGVLADAMAMNTSCPPAGPFGSNTGDTTPNVELQDCDGNTVRLHDFCNRKATWMFSLPLW